MHRDHGHEEHEAESGEQNGPLNKGDRVLLGREREQVVDLEQAALGLHRFADDQAVDLRSFREGLNSRVLHREVVALDDASQRCRHRIEVEHRSQGLVRHVGLDRDPEQAGVGAARGQRGLRVVDAEPHARDVSEVGKRERLIGGGLSALDLGDCRGPLRAQHAAADLVDQEDSDDQNDDAGDHERGDRDAKLKRMAPGARRPPHGAAQPLHGGTPPPDRTWRYVDRRPPDLSDHERFTRGVGEDRRQNGVGLGGRGHGPLDHLSTRRIGRIGQTGRIVQAGNVVRMSHGGPALYPTPRTVRTTSGFSGSRSTLERRRWTCTFTNRVSAACR